MKGDFLDNSFYNSLKFHIYAARIYNAQSVSFKINEDIELLNVSISSCNNEKANWNLEASEITLEG